jgi:hypothetical protein
MPTKCDLHNIVSKKIKLHDALLYLIFDSFHFKYISKKSSTIMIIKTIYNTFFNKHIIDIQYEGNNHKLPVFKINEECIDLFNFMCQYLKRTHYNDVSELDEESGDENVL